ALARRDHPSRPWAASRSGLSSRAAGAGAAMARASALRRADPSGHDQSPEPAAASRRHGRRVAAGRAGAPRALVDHGCGPARARSHRNAVPASPQASRRMSDDDAEFIVIGSGPAGVSAALPLAEAGRRVIMLDGGDDRSAQPTAAWERMLGPHLESL